MKTTSPKGMRDITTIGVLRSHAVPSNREQIMSRLSRLEHEKAHLERERKIWIENQHKIDERLRATEEQIHFLQEAFEQHLSPPVSDESDERTSDE